jgi:hypothetical protein
VLCFALAAAVLSAIVFALLPAVEATRSDLAAMLRDLGAAAATRGSHGLRETLVAAQVATAYCTIRITEQRLRIAHENAALQKRSLEITERLFKRIDLGSWGICKNADPGDFSGLLGLGGDTSRGS